jgi:hypothetical protein
MPTPNQQAQSAYPHWMRYAPMHPSRDGAKPVDISDEIAALREDIAALRAELVPVPSLIVTGRQALDEFKKLSGQASSL